MKYTTHQVEQIKTLLKQGITHREISKRTKVSPYSVNYYVNKFRTKKTKVTKPVSKTPIQAAFREFTITVQRLSHAVTTLQKLMN